MLQLSAEGFPPQRAIIEEIANTMLYMKNSAEPQKVGTKWVANFVKRRPELSSVYNRKFDIQRAEVEDPKLISLWFNLVGDTIAKYGVTEEDIFNFDETGFEMGEGSNALWRATLEKFHYSAETLHVSGRIIE